jgi:AcrR family transcriptional regulator
LDAREIDRGRREQVLQMGLRQTNVARTAHPLCIHCLRNRPLQLIATRIGSMKLSRLLSFPPKAFTVSTRRTGNWLFAKDLSVRQVAYSKFILTVQSRIGYMNLMARPKEFERDTALQQAIKVFADHGFEGTSTEALMQAMGISRQSMYDTFGDKRQLYLEALQHYNANSVSALIKNLHTGSSPIKGLEAALLAFAAKPAADGPAHCMGTSAICEFGRSDQQVSLVTDTSSRIVLSAFERLIGEAKEAGETGPDIDVQAAAQFMLATISGMKIAARGGATPEVLRNIARMALRSLR